MFSDEDLEKICELLKSGKPNGWWNLPEGGKHVKDFEESFAEFIGVKHAVAVSSGTASIYVAFRACGIGVGDLVAVSAYTYIGCVAAIAMTGAKPVFIDVDKYGNINLTDFMFMQSQHPRTLRSALLVHQLGFPCNLDGFKINAKFVVEDCSHALGAEYKGRKTGSIGNVGCFSVGGDLTKAITTGEGGMLTTDDDDMADACRHIRNHGETWGGDYLCFNFRMSELQALTGLLQMPTLQDQIDWQTRNAEYLISKLPKYLQFAPLQAPVPHVKPAYYFIGCDFLAEEAGITRDEFLEHVKEKGFEGGMPRRNIGGGYKNVLYDLPYYRRYARDCPMAMRKRDESVWIDYHRYPRTKEEIDELLTVFMEVQP